MNKKIGICLVAVMVSSVIANAAIIGLVDSATDAGAGATSSTISGFNLGAGNALVVMISGESSSTSPEYSVSFGGTAVADNLFTKEGNQGAGIFYWINPAVTSGDVVVNFNSTTLYSVSVMSLNNVGSLGDSGTFGEPASGMPYNMSYTGTAGGFVAASFVDNDYANSGGNLTIAGDNIDTYLARIGGNSIDSAGRAQAYGDITAGGTFSETFTNGGVSSRNAGALASFTAIPEPVTLGLVVAMGGGLLFIRRLFMM